MKKLLATMALVAVSATSAAAFHYPGFSTPKYNNTYFPGGGEQVLVLEQQKRTSSGGTQTVFTHIHYDNDKEEYVVRGRDRLHDKNGVSRQGYVPLNHIWSTDSIEELQAEYSVLNQEWLENWLERKF